MVKLNLKKNQAVKAHLRMPLFTILQFFNIVLKGGGGGGQTLVQKELLNS